jgi:hypothetical protein
VRAAGGGSSNSLHIPGASISACLSADCQQQGYMAAGTVGSSIGGGAFSAGLMGAVKLALWQ